MRETREETGIACEVTGLVGIYTDPRHVILYTSDGEARQEFSVVFTARPISGTPTTSSETREVEWVAPRRGRRAADGPLDAAAHRALPVRRRPRPTWADATVLSADWASVVVDAVAAIGTLGAFAVGFVLLRREHHREAARAEDDRRSQAVKVSAWVEAQRTAQGGREVLLPRAQRQRHADLRGLAADPGRGRRARPSSSAWSHPARPSNARRRGSGWRPTTHPNRSRSSSSTAAAASGPATSRASSTPTGDDTAQPAGRRRFRLFRRSR